MTTSTLSPAAARTPFQSPKLYPCTNAVCAENPYSTPPSSRNATVPRGMFSDATSSTISSTHRRLRSGRSPPPSRWDSRWTSTDATSPRDGPRTTASAPPASESHPSRVQPRAASTSSSSEEEDGDVNGFGSRRRGARAEERDATGRGARRSASLPRRGGDGRGARRSRGRAHPRSDLGGAHRRADADGDARAAAARRTRSTARGLGASSDARETHSRSRCRSIGVPRRSARVKARGKKTQPSVRRRAVEGAEGRRSSVSLNLVGRRTRRGGAGRVS